MLSALPGASKMPEQQVSLECVTGSVMHTRWRFVLGGSVKTRNFSVKAHALHASHVHDAQLTHIYGGSGVPERKILIMGQSWLGWMLLT